MFRYFFAATVFLVYGRAIQQQLVASFGYEYHLIGGFGLLIAGLVMEVLSLRPQYYRPQIRHFARILVGLMLTVVQCGTMVFNLFQGMIWCAAVACGLLSLLPMLTLCVVCGAGFCCPCRL